MSVFRVFALSVLLLGCGIARAAERLPSFAEVRAAHPSSYAELLDRDHAVLATLRVDRQRQRLAWMPLSSLGQPMKNALLAAEDRRFFQHSGIDWRAFAAAVWQNLWYDRARGASTLSMQLAGLLDPALRPHRATGGRRTLVQKWDQAWAATELEHSWSKAQILEAYLNLAPLRGQLEGVPAAAHFLFGKTPAALDPAEAAIIAVLLRGPNAPPARVARRACVLLGTMHESAACPQARHLSAGLDSGRHVHHSAARAIAARLALQPGEAVVTTLSRPWQDHLVAALEQGGHEAAAVVVDNASGDILAWAGLPPGNAQFAPHPAVLPLRWLQLAEGLGDEAVDLASLVNVAMPGEDEAQWASVRQALQMLRARRPVSSGWIDALPRWRQQRVLQRLGSGDGPGAGRYSAGEVPALDLPALASLVRAVATDGNWRAPRLLPRPQAEARLSSPAGAFLLRQVWRARQGRPADLAVLRLAGTDGWWELAFDRSVSAVVWFGGKPPARPWLPAVLQQAPGAQALPPARPPAGVVSAWVGFAPPVEAARLEWFLQERVRPLEQAPGVVPGIRWPANGTLVDARDLDGAPVHFSATGGSDAVRWRLDGEIIGSGAEVAWHPQAGLYLLELLGPDGEVLDAANFAVRGPLQQTQQQPGEQRP